MNRKLLAVAVAGAVAPMGAQALDVSVSGQVNRAIRFADNGAGSDVQHIDGSASGSRYRFTAEGEVMGGITAGAHIESEFASNRGWQADVDQPDEITSPSPSTVDDANGDNMVDYVVNHDEVEKGSSGFRHSYIYFSGDFGKVTLGHTSPAGNSAMWKSHNGAWMGTEYSPDTNSGISVISNADDMFAGGSNCIRATGETRVAEDPLFVDGEKGCYSVVSFFPSINIGRRNTLRYDTPSIGPVSFAASMQKDGATKHAWSFGADLSHDVGAANVIGGLLLMEDVLGISGGILFAQGTSVNAAWGTDDGEDYEDMYINLAHTWGNMSVAVQYRSTENGDDMEGDTIGLGASYSLGSGVDVYAGFNNYSFDAPGWDLEDVNAFHLGSRVTFD